MKITTSTDEFGLEYVTIEINGHFTTMLKSVYDEIQAAKDEGGTL